MTNDPSALAQPSVERAPARERRWFIRDSLLTVLFSGALLCLYLPRYSWWLPLLVLLPPLPVAAISARGWVRPPRRAAQALMALTVLIAAVYVLRRRETEGVAALLYSSDTVAPTALCRSLMHREPLSGWVFGAMRTRFSFTGMAVCAIVSGNDSKATGTPGGLR